MSFIRGKCWNIPGITHVTDDVVNSWYPKNFSEKVDMILCALADRTEYLGQELSISPEEIGSLFMLKKCTGENTNGDAHILDDQLKFFYRYFGECGYNSEKYSFYKITLKPSAWKRIDELHKNSNGNSRTDIYRNVFQRRYESCERADKGGDYRMSI